MDRDPRSLRRLIDEAFVYLRRHFVKIYFPVAIPIALLSGGMPLVQGLWVTREMQNANPASLRPAAFLFVMAASVGVTLVYLSIHMLGSIALVGGSLDAIRLGAVDMGRSWRRAFDPRVFGTSLLTAIIVGLGMMCCLLPGLYAALLFGLVVPVVLAEGLYGRAALERTYALTTHNPTRAFTADPRFRVFVVLAAGFLMQYAISILVSLPMIVLQQVLMFRSIAEGARPNPYSLMRSMMWVQVPTTVLQTLTQETIALYVSLTLSLLFFDLREQREGLALEAEIDGLVKAPPPSPSS
jgi:hypothetical protein